MSYNLSAVGGEAFFDTDNVRSSRILGLILLLACAPIFLSPLIASGQSLPNFTLLTEEWKPYNYRENQTVKGIAVDLLVTMLHKTGSRVSKEDIKLLPWPRAYAIALHEPNTVLFSTTRTREREKLFKWVGPIDINTTELIAKKERHIKITSVQDLTNYTIGTIYNDVGEQLLLDKGVPLNNLQQVPNRDSNQHKLHSDRIDLIVGSLIGHQNYCKDAGYDPKDYESVFVLNKDELFYAFHCQTPDPTIHLLQKALDNLKADGTYQAIVDSYRK